MSIVVTSLFAILALAEPASVGPIPVGANVAVAIKALGMPLDVASLDSGHTWSWRTPHAELHAITDDDAIVRAVDDAPLDGEEKLAVGVEGKTIIVPLRGYTTARADADLGAVANLSSRTSRLFDLGRGRALLMLFDDSATLTHAVYGERGFIARLGLITADAEMVKTMRYVAPRLRNGAAPAPSAAHEAVIRYEIGADGRVAAVAIEVSSHDPAIDDRALKLARRGAWTPAKLNNRPVKSVAFRLIQT